MDNEIVLSRINSEIEKIDKNKNNVYFFVFDTKGNPSGNLLYIYNLALILKNANYNVAMLYQNEDFVGVNDWIGDEYNDLPHYDINKSDLSVSASDILFIPEIFANVMMQTKKLPCKRIVILQNYNFMVEQMPISAQWGDFGIFDAITNTDKNGEYIKDVFPYVRTTTIAPYIDKIFGSTKEPKKMIVNIISSNVDDVNKIIKPFYWKYPIYKWVSFRDVRGFDREKYASMLREAAITIWVDDDTNFGYSALEALKSGSIVIAKHPNSIQNWMVSNEQSDMLTDSCLWFNDFHDLPKLIASVIRAWVTDNIPDEINAERDDVLSKFSMENTSHMFVEYVSNVLLNRKKEMEEIRKQINTNENK